jgi:hypothetical protein
MAAVDNIGINSIIKKPAFLTAKGTVSAFQKREVDGQYFRLRLAKMVRFGFDMGGPMEVKRGYTK